MNGNLFRILLLLIAAVSFKNVQAQGPPIYTGTPILLGLEGGGVRTFGRYISKENATAYVQPFAIPYNIATKFQVGVIVPFVSKSPEGLEVVELFLLQGLQSSKSNRRCLSKLC